MKHRFSLLASVMLMVMLVLLTGCDRQIESKDPLSPLPDAPPQPSNLVVQLNNRTVSLSWDIGDSTDVVRYRAYYAKGTNGDFILRDSTTGRTIDLSSLPLNQVLTFAVAAVNSAGIESARSEEVQATVGLLSMAIENNNEFTNNRNVTIALNVPSAASFVELSEDSLFASGSIPRQFAPNVSFTLSQGDGEKAVFARFTFTNGNESGVPVSDRIILDSKAYIDSVYFNQPFATFLTGDTVRFFLKAGESGGVAAVSFPGASNIRLYDDGNAPDAAAGDSIYSAYYVIPMGLSVTGGQVAGDFTDAAGNNAVQAMSSSLIQIQSAPTAVQLASVEAISSFEITLRWSESGTSNFSEYRIYRSLTSSVNTSSELVRTISQKSSINYTDTTVNDNTQYYYRVYVVDNSGLRTGSNIDSATTPVNTAPTAVTAAVSLSDSTTARLTWTENGDPDFASYRIYRDTSPGVGTTDDLLAIITSRSSTSHTDFLPFAPGTTVYYRVIVFDRQGLTANSNEVQVTN